MAAVPSRHRNDKPRPAASARAWKVRRKSRPGKIIHNYFGTTTDHLDRSEPLREGLKAGFIRRLTSSKQPHFIGFWRCFRIFVRARTVLPFSPAFTDC